MEDFQDQLVGNTKGLVIGKQKFSFPMTNSIFEVKFQDDEEFQIQTLVSRLTELHFYSGRLGWTGPMK